MSLIVVVAASNAMDQWTVFGRKSTTCGLRGFADESPGIFTGGASELQVRQQNNRGNARKIGPASPENVQNGIVRAAASGQADRSYAAGQFGHHWRRHRWWWRLPGRPEKWRFDGVTIGRAA